MKYVISTDRLTKVYGEKIKAVDAIDLKVSKGEIFGLLGPNGAGKTTTIGMLTTIIKPTDGSAEVNGYSIIKDQDKVRKSIGIVFQDFSLDTILTGRENLEMSAQLYGLKRDETTKRIDELLDLVDLKARADSLVKTYSGGMKRRLELARGLLHKPVVLFLDEPTLGLDPQSRDSIWKYIKNMAETERTTIMLTTHYMEEADLMCDKIAIIDHGKIIKEGTPDSLKRSLGGDIVYVKAPKIDVNALKKLSFVKDIQNKDGQAKITVTNSSANLAKLLSSIHNVKAVELRSPTLNDVFLEYTGRNIRDENGDGSWFEDVMRQSQKR